MEECTDEQFNVLKAQITSVDINLTRFDTFLKSVRDSLSQRYNDIGLGLRLPIYSAQVE
jgi:tRNA A37 threonylcarbamoyladenosine dehydratase